MATLTSKRLYRDRPPFLKDLKAALKKAEVSVAAAIMKAILSALSERDETAEVCLDKQGKPEPDSELRDSESVPFGEDVKPLIRCST